MTMGPHVPPAETEVDEYHDDDVDDSPAGLAEAASRDPVVVRWLRRFKKVAKDMPPSVWVFVASGTPAVCATGKDGMSIHEPGNGGGVDRASIITTVEGGMWDGGDW